MIILLIFLSNFLHQSREYGVFRILLNLKLVTNVCEIQFVFINFTINNHTCCSTLCGKTFHWTWFLEEVFLKFIRLMGTVLKGGDLRLSLENCWGREFSLEAGRLSI